MVLISPRLNLLLRHIQKILTPLTHYAHHPICRKPTLVFHSSQKFFLTILLYTYLCDKTISFRAKYFNIYLKAGFLSVVLILFDVLKFKSLDLFECYSFELNFFSKSNVTVKYLLKSL